MNTHDSVVSKTMPRIKYEEETRFTCSLRFFCHVTAIVITILLFSHQSLASTLQIDPAGVPPNWDRLNTTQTGSVGGTPVTFTTTNTRWAATFSDENPLYVGTGWGSLAHSPSDGTGDFLGIYVDKGDVFRITVTLNGELKDPVFYFHDLDAVDATITFPVGFSVSEHNADGRLSGGVFTVLSGLTEGTSGAFIAVQYQGTYVANDQFVFEFDYSNVTVINNELISLGMAIPENIQPVQLDMSMLDQTGATITRAKVGDIVTYHLTAENHSGEDQTGVVVVNTLPPESEMEFLSATPSTNVSVTQSPLANPTTVTWPIGDLFAAAPSNEASLDIEMQIKAGIIDGADIINSAQITSPFSSDIVSVSLGIGGADLEVRILIYDGVAISVVRFDIIHEYVVINHGPENSDDVKLRLVNSYFSDPEYIDVGNLAPGEQRSYVYRYREDSFGSDYVITAEASVGSGVIFVPTDPLSFLVLDPDLTNNYTKRSVTVFRSNRNTSGGGGGCLINVLTRQH